MTLTGDTLCCITGVSQILRGILKRMRQISDSTGTKYIALTKGDIDKVSVPKKDKRIYYYFKKVPGLTLQVTSNGIKTFQVFKRIKGVSSPYRKVLGKYPMLSPDSASRLARVELGLLESSGDPRIKRKEEAQMSMTYGDLYERYMNEYAKQHTKGWKDTEASYKLYFKTHWHRRTVGGIKHSELEAWVNNLGETSGKATANRNLDIFAAILHWGIKKQIIKLTHDPSTGITRFKTKARERFLMPNEFEKFKKALDTEPSQTMKDFFWMLLYTGIRSGNVMAMRWDQIQWDLKQWIIPDTKNDDSQIVNLVPDAMKILQERYDTRQNEDWVFPSTINRGRKSQSGHLEEPKGAWKELLKRAGLYSEDKTKRLRIHDIRRTVGSYMAIQGVDSKVIGKALGHRSSAATAIYARLTQDPVRIALLNAVNAFGNANKLVNQTEQEKMVIAAST